MGGVCNSEEGSVSPRKSIENEFNQFQVAKWLKSKSFSNNIRLHHTGALFNWSYGGEVLQVAMPWSRLSHNPVRVNLGTISSFFFLFFFFSIM